MSKTPPPPPSSPPRLATLNLGWAFVLGVFGGPFAYLYTRQMRRFAITLGLFCVAVIWVHREVYLRTQPYLETIANDPSQLWEAWSLIMAAMAPVVWPATVVGVLACVGVGVDLVTSILRARQPK